MSGKPILLIYDGHKSHETIALRERAEQHNVHLFCLPPHTTHRLQPLDVGCFGPLQRAWQKRCAVVMEATGEGISKKNFVREYMIAREEAFKEETIRKAWKSCGLNPLDPGKFTEEDYAPSYTTSTTLHLPETYPVDEPPPDEIDLSSDDPMYEPTINSELSDSDSESSELEIEGCHSVEGAGIEHFFPQLSNGSGSRAPAMPPPQVSCLSSASEFQGSSLTQAPAFEYSTTHPGSTSHRKTRSQSMALSRSATPASRPATPWPPSTTGQLKTAEERIDELENENCILKGMKDAAETHCYFSAQMITHLQKRLEAKEGDTGKRQRAHKINSSARVLTSEEGREELRQLQEQEELKKQKEADVRAKKAVEEQARRERRADPGRIFAGTLSKAKKKEELEDLAAALALPETGKKEELFARISEHFERHPQLKLDNRFKDLFPSTRSRKRLRMDDVNDDVGPSRSQQPQHISIDVSMGDPSNLYAHPHAQPSTSYHSSFPSSSSYSEQHPLQNVHQSASTTAQTYMYHPQLGHSWFSDSFSPTMTPTNQSCPSNQGSSTSRQSDSRQYSWL